MDPCIRAPSEIPLESAGPVIGLQGISTGIPELKPYTGAGAGAGHEIQVQVQASIEPTQGQALKYDKGTIRSTGAGAGSDDRRVQQRGESRTIKA